MSVPVIFLTRIISDVLIYRPYLCMCVGSKVFVLGEKGSRKSCCGQSGLQGAAERGYVNPRK
jgi:hypothetical protein